MTKLYTVFVDDNFHYMDESKPYRLGEFEDCSSAVEACKKIVDEFFGTCSLDNNDAEIFKQYTFFGEDPWILSVDSECKFSGWNYARERAKALARKK
jgi:hypothetical protein